jgi:hypothetical protein
MAITAPGARRAASFSPSADVSASEFVKNVIFFTFYESITHLTENRKKNFVYEAEKKWYNTK